MRITVWAGRALAASAVLLTAACATTPSADDPLRLADREAILVTLARYTSGLDQLDPELYVSALAEDGELVLYEDEVYAGHEALAGYVAHEAAERAEARARGEERIQFHLYSNQRIEFTAPDTALHHAYWTAASRGPAGDVDVGFVGRLTDTFVLRDGEWLVLRREVFANP